MAKKKYSRRVTPKGIAKFAYLNEPQAGYTAGDPPKYKVRLLLDDTPEVREQIDKWMEEAKAEAKKNGDKLKKVFKNPFEFPEDQDEDDYVPAEGKDYAKLDEDHKERIFVEFKAQYAPGLIDSQKNSLPDDVKIMSGDVVRVKFQYNPYEGFGSGVSLRLVTVQLIEKNTTFSAGGVDADGFDEEEDGYVADQSDDDDEIDDEIPF